MFRGKRGKPSLLWLITIAPTKDQCTIEGSSFLTPTPTISTLSRKVEIIRSVIILFSLIRRNFALQNTPYVNAKYVLGFALILLYFYYCVFDDRKVNMRNKLIFQALLDWILFDFQVLLASKNLKNINEDKLSHIYRERECSCVYWVVYQNEINH